jgi:chromosome segregation ATPase
LVAVTSKFKEDESQRRLLIQRLENENQAFSQKLEILETEFGGSAAMGMSLTDMTTTTGASQQTERDNMKLKKQKRVYEARIESLQTQLSEIQQIVPELMSKSKLQIQKLENVIEHQRQETKENETKLMQEVAKLREQNAQLQAATRSRLQSSDVERQHEIEELRLRLEAREATIKKLEALGSSGGSIRKKGGKILRKKKKKSAAANDDGDMSVLSVSTWGTEQQL